MTARSTDVPLSNAFFGVDRAIDRLSMNLSRLFDRLQASMVPAAPDSANMGATERQINGSSTIVNIVDQQAHKIDQIASMVDLAVSRLEI